MKWIKASERLPEENKKIIIRWFWKDGNNGVCWQNLYWIKEQQKFSKGNCVIEWLDESGSEPEGKEAVELREALEKIAHDAYPVDIFPPITSEQWKEIHEMIKEKFGFPIDRLTAEYGRLLRKPIISIATEALNKIWKAEAK